MMRPAGFILLLLKNFADSARQGLADMPAYGEAGLTVKRPAFAPAVLLGKAKKRGSWFN